MHGSVENIIKENVMSSEERLGKAITEFVASWTEYILDKDPVSIEQVNFALNVAIVTIKQQIVEKVYNLMEDKNTTILN